MIGCGAVGAFGEGLDGSAHDLTTYDWLPSDYICLPCHSAQSTFNHQLSTETYTITASPTINAADLRQPSGISANCLSCHDGSVPLDSFGGNVGSTYMTGPAVLGTDLRSHHPVSFTYNSALAVRDGALKNPLTAPSGLGRTIAQDMLSTKSKLECDACHNQHGYGGFEKFLVKPIEGAALCHTCHKAGVAAGAHHIPGRLDPWNNCTMCHGVDLEGGMGPSCMACHNDFAFPDPPMPGHHLSGRDQPFGAGGCTMCHGADLTGDFAPSCYTCHGPLWSDPGDAPIADASGPYSAVLGAPVSFDGSGSADPDGTIVDYRWDFGDGSSGSGVSPSHTYAAEGTFTVTLTVTDDSGMGGTDTTTANVQAPTNWPPYVDAGGPYSGIAGQSVRFDASGTTDPEQDTLSYQWDFGDGSPTSESPVVDHTYDQAGSYTAQLTVSDGFNTPVVVDVAVEIGEDTGWPEEDDVWDVRAPNLSAEFTVRFEQFAGILLVQTMHSNGAVNFGLGIEYDGVIFWMDASQAIFFGNIDRVAGIMQGIMFDDDGGGSIWFAQKTLLP